MEGKIALWCYENSIEKPLHVLTSEHELRSEFSGTESWIIIFRSGNRIQMKIKWGISNKSPLKGSSSCFDYFAPLIFSISIVLIVYS